MNELAVFDEVAAIIASYKIENEKLTFDYASKEGAKQAKSLMAKLRKVKTKVGEIHKEAKAEALAFGRKLDAKKNEYNGEVDKMIKFHKDPLDAIEAEVIAESLKKQQELADVEAKRLAEIEARERAIILAEEKIAREKDEAEEKIRRETAAEAEKLIKEQQAEAVKMQAELDREKAIRQARDKVEEDAKTKELADAMTKARKKAEQERAEAERIADKSHREKIEGEIHAGLTKLGLIPDTAYDIVEALKENKIPHVSINY